MSDVFISYARSTESQAKATAAQLRALGYSVWIDEDLPSHRAYSDVIEEQLAAAKAVVVIWSAEAVKSQWVRSEANRARSDQKLVQINIDGAVLPMPFDQVQCAQLAGWLGVDEHPAWPKVVASVAELVGGRHPGAPPPAPVDERFVARPVGERRHLTVLNCTLVNAAEIAARLDPEQWHEIASQYQREAARAVGRLDGHVAKFLGDELIVYFGYPEAREDAAERAVRAGLAITETISALNDRLEEAHEARLSIRIGIHTGTVVVARGGGDQVDMFGDAPALASGAQALAAPDTVVMTSATHDLVSGLFVIEDLGERRLAGVDQPLRLYRAIRSGLAGSRARGFAPRETTPFVGREEEMQLLSGRWRRVRDGEGQMVLVMGEAGIGKTRLIEEFRASIKADPHLWIECAGAPLFANTPFHAVAQMLDQGLGWDGDESGEARVARLEQALAPVGMHLREAVPLIAEMLSLSLPASYPQLEIAPDQKRRRLLAALTGWVFSATKGQPLVIVAEDLQWIDPSTMELIHTLVEQGGTAPLMLLCTARPEFRPTWLARGHHAQVTVGRLNKRDTRELVVSRGVLAEDVIEKVIARTDGVPLFAEELTRLMVEGHGRAGAREIPATLLDSLAARLDRLGRAREVALLASVLGREFSYELLQAVAPMPEPELQSDLTRLADAEVIYARGLPPDASYRFKHALTQDAAYEALLKSRRRELHARVARTIAERFAALAQTQPEVLARHWTEAGEAIPAIAAWKSAGDGAYGRRAFKEAETNYRRALAMIAELPPSPERDQSELELCSALSRVLQLTRGYAATETVEAAARAKSLAEKLGNISQLIREEARIWRGIITTGDYAAAAALADHILDLARGADNNPGRLLFAHNAQVQTRFYTGDLAGVEKHFALLSPLIDAEGLKQAPGNNNISLGVASLAAWAMGRADTAHERMDRALAFAELTKNPYDMAMALHFQGILFACQRDAEKAGAAASKMLALSEENGFSYAVDLARTTLAWARGQLGAPAEGLAMLGHTRVRISESGTRVGSSYGLKQRAETEAADGQTAAALATFEQALTVNPQERVFRPDTLWCRGELRLRLGETDLARADFTEALAEAKGMGARAWELRSAVALARLLRVSGETGAARDLLAPLYGAFTEGLDAVELKAVKSLLGELGA